MSTEVKAMYHCRVWWWEINETGESLVVQTEEFTDVEVRDAFLTEKVNKGELFDILAVAESYWTEPGPMSDAEWDALMGEYTKKG